MNAKDYAAELLRECRQPLGTSSLLAASPDYTAEVFRAAIEIAYELGVEGVEGAELPEPERFRTAVNRLAQHRAREVADAD